jgi:serine/threonine protein kinase
MTGTMLWNYRVHEKLGEGGMGTVYRAEDLRLGRFVALKFLSPALRTDEWARRHFCREAHAGAAVNHPNVCRVYDLAEAGHVMYIAMALIEGRDLAFYATAGRLRVAHTLDIAAQIADGLAAAHGCGVMHLDIKPSNVILGRDGRPVIIDFGLASVPGTERAAPEKATAGTIAYMSPEQIAGDGIDCRADIWALGVVLYELLAGHLPFRGAYRQAISYSVLNEEPEPLAIPGECPHVCGQVKTILGKALAKAPSDRYSSAEEFGAELRNLFYFVSHHHSTRCIGGRPACQPPPWRSSERTTLACETGHTQSSLRKGCVETTAANLDLIPRVPFWSAQPGLMKEA